MGPPKDLFIGFDPGGVGVQGVNGFSRMLLKFCPAFPNISNKSHLKKKGYSILKNSSK